VHTPARYRVNHRHEDYPPGTTARNYRFVLLGGHPRAPRPTGSVRATGAPPIARLRSPRSSQPEAGEQHEVAFLEPAVVCGFSQRYAAGRGRGVAGVVEADRVTLRIDAEPLAHGVDIRMFAWCGMNKAMSSTPISACFRITLCRLDGRPHRLAEDLPASITMKPPRSQ